MFYVYCTLYSTLQTLFEKSAILIKTHLLTLLQSIFLWQFMCSPKLITWLSSYVWTLNTYEVLRFSQRCWGFE